MRSLEKPWTRAVTIITWPSLARRGSLNEGSQRVSSRSAVGGVDFRYELRRCEEIVATGHLSCEDPLEVGDRIEIGGQAGIVRTIEPLLGEREVRVVVQLSPDRG